MSDLKKSMNNEKIEWGTIRRDAYNPPSKKPKPNFTPKGLKPKNSTEKKSA